MNKKRLFTFVLVAVAIVTFIVYRTQKVDFKDEIDTTSVISPDKNEATKINPQINSQTKQKNKEVDEVASEMDKAIKIQDEVDQKWSLKLIKFFSSNDLGMTLDQYQTFREEYSNKYLALMDKFHEELEEAQKYNPTEEPTPIVELKKNSHENLLKKMGRENYVKFLELRDRFNESIFEDHPGKFFIYTEF